MFYVSSFPRSGNTWVRSLLMTLTDTKAVDVNPRWHQQPQASAVASHVILPRQLITETVHSVCVKSHGKASTCVPGIPIIYLVRDGRDAMYSYYHFNVDHVGYTESWSSWFDRHVRERPDASAREIYLDAWMGDWSENVRSYLDHDDVLVVRYEDMLTDTRAQLNRILRYLCISVEASAVNRAIEKHTADLATKRATHSRPRGRTGAWKDAFSSAQNAAFTARHETCLERFNYPLGLR